MITRRHWLQMGSAALGLASCSTSEERPDLVFISPSEPSTLDPAQAYDQASGRVITSLYEGLMRWNEKGQPVPGVAADYPDITEEGRCYRFRLRPEARWSNGDPVTAHDFFNSWRRVLDPDTAAENAGLYQPIVGAKDYAEGRIKDFSQVGLKIVDEHTLEVRLGSPTPYFLGLCAMYAFCPVHLTSLAKAKAAQTGSVEGLVGNGAWTLAEWRLNYRLLLKRAETYWDRDNVALRHVELRTISSATTALNFFLTGAADLILDKDGVPNTMVDAIRGEPWFHSAPFLGSNFMRFNCVKAGPLKDPRVRQAFSLSIDRDRVVKNVTRMGEVAAHSLPPPGCGANYQPYCPEKLRDPNRARALLAEAGYPQGRGFPLVTYLYPSRDMDISLAIELQHMWEETLGVKILLQKQEWKVYLDSMKKVNYDICRSSWVGDYNDPNTFLEIFTAGNPNNRTGWADAAFDRTIAQAAAEPDPQKRLALLSDLEKRLVWEEAVVAPVYHYVGVQFYRSAEFSGIASNVVDEHPFRCMKRLAAG